MVLTAQTTIEMPHTLAEFVEWEPADGFKYEWHDGEVIKFIGMNNKQVYIYDILLELFFDKKYNKLGTFVAEYDVQLSEIQMRRPDIAFLTKEQIKKGRLDNEHVIPEFMIEVISSNDQLNAIKNKLRQYFLYGVRVVWLICPDQQEVEVYTSYKDVKICTGNDVCSAKPVLPDFEITVNDIFIES